MLRDSKTHSVPIDLQCEQCKSKGIECTSSYIEALAEKKKKADEEQPSNFRRKKRRKSNSHSQPPPVSLNSALCPVHPELKRRTSNESGNSKASSASQMDHSAIQSPAMGMTLSIAGDETDADKLHRVQAAQHVRENASAIAE